MNVFAKILGVLIIFVSILFIKSDYQNLIVLKKGNRVNVSVTYVSDMLGAKYNFIRFEYHGKEYSKSTGSVFNEKTNIGDIITLVYDRKRKTFLFEQENPIKEIIVSIIFIIGGLFLIFKKNIL